MLLLLCAAQQPWATGAMEVGPDYDEKFEFDAPRYYDFESTEGGTPCDKWFDTAPDGPGCKPDKGKRVRVVQ